VPLPFELHYDAAKIDPKHMYALSARIAVNEQLMFRIRRRISDYPRQSSESGHFAANGGRPNERTEAPGRQQPFGTGAALGARSELRCRKARELHL
jgi:hypothetical protein